ncbi:MAG: HTH domain-containing protein [Pseudolactococcus laudensis]|uniref:HTH domain-containing protein n=1 Tax=Pseudolactococcus laudensis TaxID=1494461 RepID=UPI003F98BC4C
MEEVFLLLAANKDIPVPVNSFCRKLNITDRTLRTDINSLNELIHSEDIEIQLIHGKGYQLFSQSNDSSSIYMIQQEILSKRTETDRLDSSEDRLFYIVRKLLYATKPIPIETISETIFVAESTIYSYLKPIRALVKKYNLRLKNRTNLGLSIEGNEIDKRRLITNVLVEHNFTEYISGYTEIEQKLFQDIELEKIKGTSKNL